MNHETPNLYIRPLALSNKKLFTDLLQHPLVCQYCFDIPTEHEAEAIFESRLADGQLLLHNNATHNAWLCLALFTKTTQDFVGINGFKRTTENSADVGYIIHPQHWQKGYASESLKQVIAIAKAWRIQTLRAHVTEGNTASFKLLEKHGFVLQALNTLPDHERFLQIQQQTFTSRLFIKSL